MPTMNETSTITLPECHNLLALLFLNLNTPSVSSSSTTQEEEMIKKKEKKRQCSHRTRCKTAEQSKSSSIIPGERDRPHTQDTPSKKRDKCHIKKKERQTKPVYHHEHANTNHVHERRITPQRDKKKKEKPHDTFPASPTTAPRDPSRHPDPHPIILFSAHLRAPVLIISATAHTLNYTLLPTPCPHTTRRHCTTMLLPLTRYFTTACLHPARNRTHALSRSR